MDEFFEQLDKVPGWAKLAGVFAAVIGSALRMVRRKNEPARNIEHDSRISDLESWMAETKRTLARIDEQAQATLRRMDRMDQRAIEEQQIARERLQAIHVAVSQALDALPPRHAHPQS